MTSPSRSIGIPNIPPRGGRESAAGSAAASPSQSQSQSRGLLTPHPSQSQLHLSTSYGRTTPGDESLNDNLTDEQRARIVARHLVDRQGQSRVRRASRGQQAQGLAGETNDVKKRLRKVFGNSKTAEEGVLDDDEHGLGEADADNDEDDGTHSPSKLPQDPDEFPMPFGLQGGDTTHGVYAWQRKAIAANSPALRKRSKSVGELSSLSGINNARDADGSMLEEGPSAGGDDDVDPNVTDVKKMLEPGGFRRNYIARQAAQQDDAGSSVGSPRGANGYSNGKMQRPRPTRATSSFVEFLSLYGHYAGEELEEIEEGDEEEEEEALEAAERAIPRGAARVPRDVDERTPLVKRNDTRARIARKRVSQEGKQGEATVTQAVLMLLKSFVGTGILFLGRAFFNGGMLFSIIVLLSIAMISLYSFLLLVQTRLVVPTSFGDIGGVLYGPYMRYAILTSITLSQVGFVSAYTIFVAQNMQAFIMAVTDCRTYIPIAILIFAQILFYLPLAMFRNIHKLSGTALIADGFILIGIVYIAYLEIGHLNEYGLGDVVLLNKAKFPLLIGTAVFSFEGVGLVIPITEAMKEPEKFPKVLSGVMVGVASLFAAAGALGYATFGSDIQTVVLTNLPQDDRLVNAVQFLYSIAIMLSTPLQLFPAVRIMEQGIFSRSGKYSNRIKWQKNAFRSLTVLGCTLISWAGARDLDKFVALIGSTACVPLCFCYPALLHYKACAKNRREKLLDIILVTFGVLMAIYTSIQTIDMFAHSKSDPPKLGKCPVPE